MANPQEGDIGTKIRYNAQESLADHVVGGLKLKWRKRPSDVDGQYVPEVVGEWIATVYNSNYAEYTTLKAIDLIAGKMEIQIYIKTPTWEGHSDIKEFTIDSNLI